MPNSLKEINYLIEHSEKMLSFYKEFMVIAQSGAFEVINGIPILYNVNFGHATQRTILPYGAKIRVNAKKQMIEILLSGLSKI